MYRRSDVVTNVIKKDHPCNKDSLFQQKNESNLFSGSVSVAAHKFVDATGSVYQLGFASIEWM